MTRLERPRGLIRYDSQNRFAGRATRWLRPRTALYGVLLLVGASVATWALSTYRPANFGVTRIIGAPYIVSAETVRNQFLVRLVNKRNNPVQFVLTLEGAPASVRQAGLVDPVEVPALGEVVQPLVLQLPRSEYQGPFNFVVHIQDRARSFELKRQVEFLGPDVRLLRDEEEEERKHH